MEKKNKLIIFSLSTFLISEWIGLLVLIYLARIPHFIALFIAFIQLLSPLLAVINIVFLLYSLLSGRPLLTLEAWKDYLKEWVRFFVLSTLIAAIAILFSATLGTALGLSAERVTRLPLIKTMQEWTWWHFTDR